jgi:hypothetical protein
MVKAGRWRARSKLWSIALKKLIGLTGLPLGVLPRDPVQRSHAGGEVVERGEISEIALIAAAQDVAQVPEAVNRLLERSALPCRWTVSMFHLAVVLEEGDVVGGGFETQHEIKLVVHFYGGFAVVVLDAGAFDAG